MNLFNVHFGEVEGLYRSRFSNDVKVLSDLPKHGLEVDDEWANRITTIGKVGKVCLVGTQTQKMKLSKPDEAEWLINDGDDDSIDVPDSSGRLLSNIRHNFYQNSFSRISNLLIILIIIELVKAFFL